MANRDDLVEEVLLNLAGYLTDQELYGTLSGSITNSATTFTVTGSVFTDASVSGFQPGLVEVGNELMYVGAVNPSTGVFSNVIRGFRGTTAAAWSSGTVVRDNPRIPRLRVVRALNDTLDEVHPRLFGVAEDQFAAASGVLSYDLPAAAVEVFSVQLQVPGYTDEFVPSRRWAFNASPSDVSVSGKQLRVLDACPGYDVHVVYATAPGNFSEASATNEAFTTATTLPAWCKEVVTLGAASKVAQFLDAGRIAERTAEGDLLAMQSPIGSGLKLGQQLHALYQERLASAEARLRAQYAVGSIHYQV